MNILFLTITHINNIEDRGIYTDLMREFRDQGHTVYIVSPIERKFQQKTSVKVQNGISILRIKTLNLQKTNIIEKGLGIIAIEYQFLSAIKKYFSNIHFHLILYSTPPITFTKCIRQIKEKNQSTTYLLLKDIFPQNAVDIELMKRGGILHRFFKRKEKKLYEISDHIGCMSPANVKYILLHNPQIPKSKLEVCPNSIHVAKITTAVINKKEKREKYSIPENAVVFIYGGNMGKPQGLNFLLKILEANISKRDRFFLIVGLGTEYQKIKKWFDTHHPNNALLIPELPKVEYDKLVKSCDVGLIFLDPRFTIPNYPSRLLSYLEFKMPVLMATDVNTDIGPIAEKNGYGLWCENGDLVKFNELVETLSSDAELREKMGKNGYEFLLNNYTAKDSFNIIIKHIQEIEP